MELKSLFGCSSKTKCAIFSSLCLLKWWECWLSSQYLESTWVNPHFLSCPLPKTGPNLKGTLPHFSHPRSGLTSHSQPGNEGLDLNKPKCFLEQLLFVMPTAELPGRVLAWKWGEGRRSIRLGCPRGLCREEQGASKLREEGTGDSLHPSVREQDQE